jgi:cytoskeletal protein CcmA (bactofilin family)
MALKGLMARGMEGVAGATGREGRREDAGRDQTAAAPRPVLAQPPGPRSVAPSTSVDATSKLEGRLRCKETLRIDGHVVGEIECDKTVVVGQGGRVHAGIDADEVQVSGLVEGDITARRKVVLERTAVVIGNLTTPGIVIEEGAKLKGRILIGSDVEAEDEVAEAKGAESDERDAVAASPAKGTKQSKKSSAPTGARVEASKTEHAPGAPA